MSRRTIDNCSIIKYATREGIGKPPTDKVNGKDYCLGYTRSYEDDEPCEVCKTCHCSVWSLEEW